MLTPLLLLAAADATPIESRIADVTLYGTSALVHRTAHIDGSGSFVLRGMPQAMDADNVRVRCTGGDVVSVEVRERLQPSAPSERLQGLRDRLKSLGRDLQAARDDVRVLEDMGKYLASLSDAGSKTFRGDVDAQKDSTGAWNSSFAFLQQKLAENAKARREAAWKADDAQRAYEEVDREIGKLSAGGNVTVRDVIVDVESAGGAGLDVEYMVTHTGWEPFYDLRTSSDLASVELGYRARVWQQTGEDWNDVAVALSTAQPQRGAQGPEPVPQWISIIDPNVPAARAPASDGFGSEGRKIRKAEELRMSEKKDFDSADARPPPFASVEDQGLSVRFQLARRETIESREQPTTVLVGRSTLAVVAERYCTPSLDPTVWLRGRAKNTSAWTLLPGNAAVFLGADYLGTARLTAVQPGQELTLHLGADPALVVERTHVEDMAKGPGFLSSRAEKIDGWRIHVENHGARTTAGNGSVEVIVREVLPRPRDERVEVELTKSEPKPSKDERWKKDLEEKGIQTWVVRVPKDGATDIVWQSTVTYPKGAELVRQ
jgi:uncharacterized protein (TIGR02231 family)